MFKPFSTEPGQFTTDFFDGLPQETFYSTDPATKPTFEAIDYRIAAGELVEIFYDYEASDKVAKYASPREYAALAFDLRGRLLARMAFPVAIPEHQSYAIGAALVGRIRSKDMDKGWPGHMAASMVQNFLRSFSRFDGERLGLELEDFPDGEKGYSFPIPRAKGEPAVLEIHPGGKKFRLKGEKDWRKVYGVSEPFNGENYDDPMASHWFSRLGFTSLFPSSQKRHDTFREDVRTKAIWTWAFGPQGKYGLQLPDCWHRKTRRMVRSTRLGDILLANSRTANRARGVEGGAVLYDGRDIDPENMHASLEDSAGTAALSFHLRALDPSGMKQISELSDVDRYKAFLQGEKGFGDRPLIGFVHYDEGMLTRGIGMLLATNDEFEPKNTSGRRALIFNLEHNPDDYLHMGPDELRPLLVQRHKPLFIPIGLNRTPQVTDFERAYKAGAGAQHTPEEYHRRRQIILSRRDFQQRVMETWFDLTHPTPAPNLVTTRELEDDSYVHYGNLKYYYTDDISGKRKDIPKDVYARASAKWSYMRRFDALLRKVTEGHAIEYSDDSEALDDYRKRLKEVTSQLKKLQKRQATPYTLPQIPPFVKRDDDEDDLLADGDMESDSIGDEGMAVTPIEARKHLWRLRHECRGVLYSSLPEFHVINERGQRLPWDKVCAMPKATRYAQFREGKLQMVFERVEQRHPMITALRVFDADKFNSAHGTSEWKRWWRDYVKENYDVWRPVYDAYVTFGVQGPPNLDAAEHVRMSEQRGVLDAKRLLGKAAEGEASDYVRMVLGTPLGQQILAEHQVLKQKRLKQHRWTPEKMALMGYDPETYYPVPHPRFKIDRRKLARLKVPDVMLDNPDWDDVWHHFQIIQKPDDKTLKALEDVKQGVPVLLEGEATGMFRLAAQSACHRLPEEGERTQQALARASGAYQTIGTKLSSDPRRLRLLTFEQLTPIHGDREVDEHIQHVTLPAQDWAGLVDPRAGGLPAPMSKITGIILRDTGQQFTKGPIRFRRMLRGVETGDEYQGQLAAAERICVDDLKEMTDRQAQMFGKLSAADLYSSMKKIFADLRITDLARQQLWVLKLAKPVDKNTYTYFNRAEQPVASFISARPTGRRKTATPQRRAAA